MVSKAWWEGGAKLAAIPFYCLPFFFFFFPIFIYLLALLGLHCCMRGFIKFMGVEATL